MQHEVSGRRGVRGQRCQGQRCQGAEVHSSVVLAVCSMAQGTGAQSTQRRDADVHGDVVQSTQHGAAGHAAMAVPSSAPALGLTGQCTHTHQAAQSSCPLIPAISSTCSWGPLGNLRNSLGATRAFDAFPKAWGSLLSPLPQDRFCSLGAAVFVPKTSAGKVYLYNAITSL